MKQSHTFEWVPVWKYAKNIGTTRQNVYRWLREGKIPTGAFKREKVVQERLFIRGDFQK